MNTITHTFTIDVEDWYHVFYGEKSVDRQSWNTYTEKIQPMIEASLELLSRHNIHATFFFVGWLADKHPALIKRVAQQGHEIASHGYWHQEAHKTDPKTFLEDIRRAKHAIEQAIGQTVQGYRAPGFSIDRTRLDLIERVQEAGYCYDSSVLGSQTGVYEIRTGLIEVPPLALRMAGRDWPVNGGFVFRFTPYFLYDAFIQWLARRNQSLTFYTHTWEILTDYPRIPMPALKSFIQYARLASVRPKLDRLLSAHRFGSIAEHLAS